MNISRVLGELIKVALVQHFVSHIWQLLPEKLTSQEKGATSCSFLLYSPIAIQHQLL